MVWSFNLKFKVEEDQQLSSIRGCPRLKFFLSLVWSPMVESKILSVVLRYSTFYMLRLSSIRCAFHRWLPSIGGCLPYEVAIHRTLPCIGGLHTWEVAVHWRLSSLTLDWIEQDNKPGAFWLDLQFEHAGFDDS